MEVRLRVFAMLRERLGASNVSLALPEGSTVSDLLKAVERRYPRLLKGVSPLLIAVNAEYVEGSFPLSDRDEVALVPPVSGGVGR